MIFQHKKFPFCFLSWSWCALYSRKLQGMISVVCWTRAKSNPAGTVNIHYELDAVMHVTKCSARVVQDGELYFCKRNTRRYYRRCVHKATSIRYQIKTRVNQECDKNKALRAQDRCESYTAWHFSKRHIPIKHPHAHKHLKLKSICLTLVTV